MNIVFILGAQAVGKMTVGQELEKVTSLRLFHNHMMIEPVLDVFGYFKSEAVIKLRDIIFEEFAKLPDYECDGLIFTYVYAFDNPKESKYIQHIQEIFTNKHIGEVNFYFVELVASLDTRIERNKTENRLMNKPSKRDIEQSEYMIINSEKTGRFESNSEDTLFDNYLKIDNTNLTAIETAELIRDYFHFEG